MRITRNQLRQIIQEELSRTLRESPSSFGHRYAEPTAKPKARKPSIPTHDQWTAMSQSDRDKVAEALGITTEELKDRVADQPK